MVAIEREQFGDDVLQMAEHEVHGLVMETQDLSIVASSSIPCRVSGQVCVDEDGIRQVCNWSPPHS